jgi:hypothetical protein
MLTEEQNIRFLKAILTVVGWITIIASITTAITLFNYCH